MYRQLEFPDEIALGSGLTALTPGELAVLLKG